ncbi:MAG: methyltransferase domain-containing protein [Thermoplasmata archaeon]|nr:methyltransferase domain-containing protein [Thermoplasmata archaeon]
MSEMKFVADHMLGKLARWLRLLGYDVIYPDAGKSDDELAKLAGETGRILLTRDKVLAAKARNGLLIKSDDVQAQIDELKEKIGLKIELELDRCSVCNNLIEKVDPEFVMGKVPEKVFANFSEFWYCRHCEKIYWYGSHVEKMRERLRTRVVLEKHLGFGGLPDSELVHALHAEGVEARVLWTQGRRFCVEVFSHNLRWAERLALWHRGFEVLHNGNIEEVLEFAGRMTVSGSFCVRAEHEPELAEQIGAKIHGRVDLKKPENFFFVFRHGKEYFFCRKFWNIDNKGFAGREPRSRPFFMPISLHPKVARAMVNLAEVRDGTVVLDPFCGTGGILIEAGLLGARVLGNDIREDIIAGAGKNLGACGIENFELFCGDVGELSSKVGEVDAIITDPPYGRSTTTKKEPVSSLYRRSFETFATILPEGKRLVIILPSKPEAQIPGFVLKELHQIYVHKSLMRHLCLFERG